MRKQYRFDTPDQLKEINVLCKDGNIMNMARVWNAARNKTSVACPWDGKIMATFYARDRKNIAIVIRVDTTQKPKEVATLKYAQSLKWCKENLTEVLSEQNFD